MIITNLGTIIRVPVTDIPVYGRSAGGVIIMRQSDESKIVNFTCLAENEEKQYMEKSESENEYSDIDTEENETYVDTEDSDI